MLQKKTFRMKTINTITSKLNNLWKILQMRISFSSTTLLWRGSHQSI